MFPTSNQSSVLHRCTSIASSLRILLLVKTNVHWSEHVASDKMLPGRFVLLLSGPKMKCCACRPKVTLLLVTSRPTDAWCRWVCRRLEVLECELFSIATHTKVSAYFAHDLFSIFLTYQQ